MKTIKNNIILLSLTLLAISSCKKFVEVSQPKNQITTSEVFADSTDANAAVIGVYINMMGSAMGYDSGGLTVFSGLSADEIYQTSNNSVYNQFYVNNISSTNSTNNGLWISAYSYIYTLNACVEGITASGGIQPSAKAQLIAEARFVRAFQYFNLVNLYGGVPVVTSTDYNVTRLTGRSSTDQVYNQIISDLQFAEANLNNSTAFERPTPYAAGALLAKVYLYTGKSGMAETEASKVINSGVFNLEPNLNSVFLASSAETIWKLLPVAPNTATFEALFFVPSSSGATPRYVLTPSLFGSFEAGDQRVVNWIHVNSVAGKTYPFPYKYKQATTSSPNEDYVMLRLADQYLIRAEAEVNQNKLTAAVADLNTIRNRAGLPNSGASDQASILAAIQRERRSEFFCEWGSRWFDLKRWNLSGSALNALKSNLTANALLYPVPSQQITSNPDLTQNPGY
jgi:hypothetical protein